MVAIPTTGIPTGGRTVEPSVARNDGDPRIARVSTVPGDVVDAGVRARTSNGGTAPGPRPDAPGTQPKPDLSTRICNALAGFFTGGAVAWGAMICMGFGPFGLAALGVGALVGGAAAYLADRYTTRGSIFPLFGGDRQTAPRRPQAAAT